MGVGNVIVASRSYGTATPPLLPSSEAETHTAVRCDEVSHPLAVEFRFPELILRDQLAGEYALLDRVRAVQASTFAVRVGRPIRQPAYSNSSSRVYSSSVSLVSVVIGGLCRCRRRCRQYSQSRCSSRPHRRRRRRATQNLSGSLCAMLLILCLSTLVCRIEVCC